ncbi:uncharacterized protein SPSK_03194 [Sporothrix schenckii 1099-18]|uniref:Protein kinase domain-containing protein n=1 Tax=Sporothrix schenckii 1099-18 TaxID=1397361 RepID=A0A0F2M017_SPOSC|nr:uncharacterized protein SPSK_03194 [Sporothrix schenckii 1099-18]KJR82100.1 hypothetical protein SPSK_03194 [Sporothrix schenckii 1099-18]
MDFLPPVGTGPSFFLVPDNHNAHMVINHPHNAAYVDAIDGEPALHLNFTGLVNDKITLGRSNCTITLPDHHGAGIQRRHCYFWCNSSTGAVILNDESPTRTTLAYDQDADFSVPMSQAMNSVVVTRRFNRNIAIGNRKHYKFKLVWDGDEPVRNFLTQHPNQFGPESFDTTKARYIQGQVLGMGGFGLVRKAVNIHSGHAMAVKRFYNLEGKGHIMAIREINNMLKLSSNNAKRHDHILPILDVVYDNKHYRWIEIFMPLREGSVYTLIEEADRALSDAQIAEQVLYQMAKALKYMAKYNMVHRDIKHANILYETRMQDDGVAPYYHFQLADFNLSNESAQARTFAGTPVFMAPEVYDRQLQSCTADIWSLFVTVVWIYNFDGFRTYSADNGFELREKITAIAQHELFEHIRDMAIQDPSQRVSARELVARLKGTSSSGRSGRAIFTGLHDDGDGAYGYVPYITDDVAQSFSNTFGSSSRQSMMSRSAMNGFSAMAEFSLAGGTMMPNPYQNGLIDEHYEYADQFPRNEEVDLDATAGFAESQAEDREDEPGSGDEDRHNMGTEADSATPTYPLSTD